jgi:hypothetical protein
MLGNDREISNYTIAVAKKRLPKQAYFHGNNGRDVFYAVRAEML